MRVLGRGTFGKVMLVELKTTSKRMRREEGGGVRDEGGGR